MKKLTKKVTSIAMMMLLSLLLSGCGKQQFSIGFIVPAESTAGQSIWSEEEISPTRRKVTFSIPSDTPDLEVYLRPVEVKEENAYEPFYLTSGQSVTMEMEKGAWFKVCIHMENDSSTDLNVCLEIKGVTVRVAAEQDGDPEYANGDEENASTVSVMRGTVKSIENGVMLVEPVEGAWERRSSDLFSVSIINMPTSPKPQVGNMVEITYQGGILETYPALFEKVISICVIDGSNSNLKELIINWISDVLNDSTL